MLSHSFSFFWFFLLLSPCAALGLATSECADRTRSGGSGVETQQAVQRGFFPGLGLKPAGWGVAACSGSLTGGPDKNRWQWGPAQRPPGLEEGLFSVQLGLFGTWPSSWSHPLGHVRPWSRREGLGRMKGGITDQPCPLARSPRRPTSHFLSWPEACHVITSSCKGGRKMPFIKSDLLAKKRWVGHWQVC